jgi:hypothetical protein
MMRVNTSCHYALRRKGGVKILVTAKNRRECASSVDYIRLNEPVTDPKHLAKAKKDGEAAQKESDDRGNKRQRPIATGKTKTPVAVDPGIADPVVPEPEAKAEAPPKPPKVLTPTQEKARKAARKKAADKKKAAKEQSKKDEAAAETAEAAAAK